MAEQDEERFEPESGAEQPDVESHKKKLADEPRDEDEDADVEAHKKK